MALDTITRITPAMERVGASFGCCTERRSVRRRNSDDIAPWGAPTLERAVR
jgi:hypothetical protein